MIANNPHKKQDGADSYLEIAEIRDEPRRDVYEAAAARRIDLAAS